MPPSASSIRPARTTPTPVAPRSQPNRSPSSTPSPAAAQLAHTKRSSLRGLLRWIICATSGATLQHREQPVEVHRRHQHVVRALAHRGDRGLDRVRAREQHRAQAAMALQAAPQQAEAVDPRGAQLADEPEYGAPFEHVVGGLGVGGGERLEAMAAELLRERARVAALVADDQDGGAGAGHGWPVRSRGAARDAPPGALSAAARVPPRAAGRCSGSRPGRRAWSSRPRRRCGRPCRSGT